jgi:hypothetical protein
LFPDQYQLFFPFYIVLKYFILSTLLSNDYASEEIISFYVKMASKYYPEAVA